MEGRATDAHLAADLPDADARLSLIGRVDRLLLGGLGFPTA